MDKATAPIDLLRKLRTHFDGEYQRLKMLIAHSGAAAEEAKRAQRFVIEIDDTLRDWA